MNSRLYCKIIFSCLLLNALSAFSQNLFYHTTAINKIPYSQFQFIYEDSDRLIWLGSGNELIRFDGQNSVNIIDIYPDLKLNGPVIKMMEDDNFKYILSRNSSCIFALPKRNRHGFKTICLEDKIITDLLLNDQGPEMILANSVDSLYLFHMIEAEAKLSFQIVLPYPYRKSSIIKFSGGVLLLDLNKITFWDLEGNLIDRLDFPPKTIPFAESNMKFAVYDETIYLSHPTISGIKSLKIEDSKIILDVIPGMEEGQVSDIKFDKKGTLLIAWKEAEGFVKQISVYLKDDFDIHQTFELTDNSLQCFDAYNAFDRIVLGGYFNLKIISLSEYYLRNHLSIIQPDQNRILETGISMRGMTRVKNDLYFAREVNTIYRLDSKTNTLIPLQLREADGSRVELRCTNDLLYSEYLDKLIIASCSANVGTNHIYFVDYKTGISEKLSFKIRVQSMAFNPKDRTEVLFGYSEHSTGLGMLNLKTKQIEVFNIPNTKDAYYVRYLEDRIWVGTKKGLLVLNGKHELDPRFKVIQESIGLSEIYHISQKGKEIFLGTSSKGLYILNTDDLSFQIKDSKDGLTSNSIAGVIRDKNKFLWLATFNGLHVFNPDGKLIRVYTTTDGTNHNEYNRYSYYDDYTRLFFGSINGILEINTYGFLQDIKEVAKPVFIQKISYQLSSEKSNINKYFDSAPSTINYPREGIDLRIQISKRISTLANAPFRVKFIGKDKNWRYEDSEGYISLSDAPEGNHELLVQTKDLAGNWQAVNLNTKISRRKYFTQTALFQSILYLVLAAAIFLYLFNLYKQRTKYYNLRESIANDLHDQVGSALTSISMKASMLDEHSEISELKNISAEAHNALQLIRDTIWSVDPENDSLEHLLDRCKDFAYKAFQSRSVEIKFNQVIDLKQKINIGLRKELYLIFKEAITNCLKHADPSYILVNIKHSKGRLEMFIENDGVLIQLQNSGITNGLNRGLKSMQKRAKAIGGQLGYHNSGEVFEITFSAPLQFTLN